MTTQRQRDVLIARNTTHGLCRVHPKTYRSWKDARSRCRNPNDSDYARYGGRGIIFSPRWDDFAVFFADMGARPIGLTLERMNRDGHYETGNCKWADKFEQANNRSNNHPQTIGGITKTLQQWCAEYRTEPSKVRYRLRIGRSPLDALTLEDMRRG